MLFKISLSILYISAEISDVGFRQKLWYFLSLMICLNTILMPEVNYTLNFTLEKNSGGHQGWDSFTIERLLRRAGGFAPRPPDTYFDLPPIVGGPPVRRESAKIYF